MCSQSFASSVTPTIHLTMVVPLLGHDHPRMQIGNVFSCVCLSVCVSICSGYNFLTASHRNFIFSMEIYIDHILVKFKYQGHVHRMIIYLFQLVIPLYVTTCHTSRSRLNQRQCQIKVTYEEKYFRVSDFHLIEMHSCLNRKQTFTTY